MWLLFPAIWHIFQLMTIEYVSVAKYNIWSNHRRRNLMLDIESRTSVVCCHSDVYYYIFCALAMYAKCGTSIITDVAL